jgi:hypothetical protein
VDGFLKIKLIKNFNGNFIKFLFWGFVGDSSLVGECFSENTEN